MTAKSGAQHAEHEHRGPAQPPHAVPEGGARRRGIVIRDRQRPIAKIVPFTPDEQEDDADLVAAGLMRKGTGRLPASFWKTGGPRVPLKVAASAVSRDRDED